MRVRTIRAALVGAVLCFRGANAATADTLTSFTDRPTFNGAVGATTVEDFTSNYHFPIPSGVLNSSTNLPGIGITPGTIKAGVTYSTPIVAGGGNQFNIDGGGGYTGGFLDTTFLNHPLTVTFDNPVAAFGFDTLGYWGSQLTVRVDFANATSLTESVSFPQYTMNFFGFQSNAVDITGAQIVDQNGRFDLDNFTWGGTPSAPVTGPVTAPLPSTAWAGIGCLGCLGAVQIVRRRKGLSVA